MLSGTTCQGLHLSKETRQTSNTNERDDGYSTEAYRLGKTLHFTAFGHLVSLTFESMVCGSKTFHSGQPVLTHDHSYAMNYVRCSGLQVLSGL